MYPHSLKGISKQIQSQISQNQTKGIKIPKSTLQKYLYIGNNKCEQAMQKAIKLMIPLWSMSLAQFSTNIKGVLTSNWPFSQNNRSIYLAIWGPVSLALFSHLLHNDPSNSRFAVLQAGAISLALILIVSYLGYVMSNVVNFENSEFFQQVCISSYINLITIVFCCVCIGSSPTVIVPMSVAYIVVATYLHFNLYRQAFNTSITYLAIMLIIMAALYTSATFLFYHIFITQFLQQSTSYKQTSNETNPYQFLRQFKQ